MIMAAWEQVLIKPNSAQSYGKLHGEHVITDLREQVYVKSNSAQSYEKCKGES